VLDLVKEGGEEERGRKKNKEGYHE